MEFTDSTEITDSVKSFVTVKRDSVVPIQGQPLSETSTIISKRTFLFTNYRYTGDLLRSFSFNFIKDLGFIGQPHETFIYGVGNNGISYLQDGVLWNNRFTNSLDLNLVQSEDIDSIEIVPSPRGFLYGPYNNPVTVNFITKDFVSPEPYSRIKYYEGPNGEAMIDGKFNSQIMRKWNLSFQATNRSVDETYTNTEFGIWQVNAKLKYFLSNSVNISGSYYFVSANQGLNGGVDFDSLTQISNDPNTDLYDPSIAPVLSPNRILDVTQHNFGLRTLAKPFEDSKLDLSLYYRFNLDELKNQLDQDSQINEIVDVKSPGILASYYHEINLIKAEILGGYESSKIELNRQLSWDTSGTIRNWDKKSIFGTFILSANLFENILIPSIYYKYTKQDFTYLHPSSNRGLSGFGGDLHLHLCPEFSVYGGYSIHDQILFVDEYVKVAEARINYNKKDIGINLRYFKRDGLHLPGVFVPPYGPDSHYFITGNLSGLGLNIDFQFWKLLFETNSSYYFDGQSTYWTTQSSDYKKGTLNLPELHINAGFYINGKFFDDNLDLKTGFEFFYWGKINSYTESRLGVVIVDPTNKLDFTLAGEIRGAAIFYFIWENLLGNQYYITPYYPMPERNIRFGLAWELFN
ncbi:MAG: TonB-dependent receptor plug domain-containing protein [Ignavibacteria bacterium]|nr:TonB-dependent receptor plug domain-containing protein [Ignavibacteria bacterium]NNL20166.1 TonB-dependent receptor plug domain-containing protein [Ignavibacteriaceae bacterium]